MGNLRITFASFAAPPTAPAAGCAPKVRAGIGLGVAPCCPQFEDGLGKRSGR
jgi:hypothetical protein